MIQDQILTVEQMKHLEDLGLDTSDASMYYSSGSSSYGELKPKKGNKKIQPGSIPVYTFADVIRNIPDEISVCEWLEGHIYKIYIPQWTKHDFNFVSRYENKTLGGISRCGDILNISYTILCWLLEKKIITKNTQRIIKGDIRYENLDLLTLKKLIKEGELDNGELPSDCSTHIKEKTGKTVKTALDLIDILPESVESSQYFYCMIYPCIFSANTVIYKAGYATYSDATDWGCVEGYSLVEALYNLVDTILDEKNGKWDFNK